MPDYQAQLARIKAKLPQARAADPQLRVFGASSHHYQVAGPVLDLDLKAFEQQYGIRLPEDYRLFMQAIGPGAGPFYGLYSPGTHADELGTTPEVALREPSQWHPHMRDAEWTALTQAFEPDDMSDAEFERETDVLFAGLLPIGTQDCTYYHALVVSGEQRGRVVNLDIERNKPAFAYELNFLDWYERWLDEVIRGVLQQGGSTWFGYTRGGTDAELMQDFTAASTTDEQLTCLVALLRLPAASSATVAQLAAAHTHADPAIRELTLQLLSKFDYQRAKPLLKAYWPTAPLPVYKMLTWYAKSYADDWLPELRHTLADFDLDPDLFQFATYVLAECTHDQTALVQPFTAHPTRSISQQATYTLQKIAGKPSASVASPSSLLARLRGWLG